MPTLNRLTRTYLSLRHELIRLVHRMAPPDTVEDIVQETYVRCCQVTDADVVKHPRAYLLRTARNIALDQKKSAATRFHEDVDVLEHAISSMDRTYEEAASQEEFALFCEAVRTLPLQCRRVFVLKKVYRYSQKEIAQELGISPSTVEKHIALGMRRCAAFMRDRGIEGIGRAIESASQEIGAQP